MGLSHFLQILIWSQRKGVGGDEGMLIRLIYGGVCPHTHNIPAGPQENITMEHARKMVYISTSMSENFLSLKSKLS